MQAALNRLINRDGFVIPYPAVDLDMGVPGWSPSVEEPQHVATTIRESPMARIQSMASPGLPEAKVTKAVHGASG